MNRRNKVHYYFIFFLIFVLNTKIMMAEETAISASTKEDDDDWGKLLAPAPLGIGVMSQLLICASRVTDFKIDKINKEAIPLLQHPDSFRTTLVQIANEAYNAFMKAHNNMEKIHLKMDQVPDYAKDALRFLNSGNQLIRESLLPQRMERIKEAADGGLELSKEVNDAYDRLNQLIQQTLTASVKSMGDEEMKIEEEKNREDVKRKQQERLQQERLQKEIEIAENNKRQKQKYLDDITREDRWNYWLSFIGFESKSKSLEYARLMKEEAEEQLKEAKKKAKDREEEIAKIHKESMAKLAKMGSNNNNAETQNETIEILREGLVHLGKLQEQWSGITRHFNQISNHFSEVTLKKIQDFDFDMNVAIAIPDHLQDIITPYSIMKLLESSNKTHHSAKMYVNVSKNYIMSSINEMHVMLGVPSSEIKEAQTKLIETCKNASVGILNTYKKENQLIILALEQKKNESANHLKALENEHEEL